MTNVKADDIFNDGHHLLKAFVVGLLDQNPNVTKPYCGNVLDSLYESNW